MTTHIDIELNGIDLFSLLIEKQNLSNAVHLILEAFRNDPVLYNPPMDLFSNGNEESVFLLTSPIKHERFVEYTRGFMYRVLGDVIHVMREKEEGTFLVLAPSEEIKREMLNQFVDISTHIQDVEFRKTGVAPTFLATRSGALKSPNGEIHMMQLTDKIAIYFSDVYANMHLQNYASLYEYVGKSVTHLYKFHKDYESKRYMSSEAKAMVQGVVETINDYYDHSIKSRVSTTVENVGWGSGVPNRRTHVSIHLPIKPLSVEETKELVRSMYREGDVPFDYRGPIYHRNCPEIKLGHTDDFQEIMMSERNYAQAVSSLSGGAGGSTFFGSRGSRAVTVSQEAVALGESTTRGGTSDLMSQTIREMSERMARQREADAWRSLSGEIGRPGEWIQMPGMDESIERQALPHIQLPRPGTYILGADMAADDQVIRAGIGNQRIGVGMINPNGVGVMRVQEPLERIIMNVTLSPDPEPVGRVTGVNLDPQTGMLNTQVQMADGETFVSQQQIGSFDGFELNEEAIPPETNNRREHGRSIVQKAFEDFL